MYSIYFQCLPLITFWVKHIFTGAHDGSGVYVNFRAAHVQYQSGYDITPHVFLTNMCSNIPMSGWT